MTNTSVLRGLISCAEVYTETLQRRAGARTQEELAESLSAVVEAQVELQASVIDIRVAAALVALRGHQETLA